MTDPAAAQEPPRPTYDAKGVLDMYFMEHRAKVLDLAAFLDRVERSHGADEPPLEDFRLDAVRDAIGILTDGGPDRARRVLERLSDRTTDPIDAAPQKGAHGAPPAPANGSGDA